MSLPEALLWQQLKGAPGGVSFRKQHPIGGYRADFYCAKARLVIEVDGIAHDMGNRPERDEARTAWLEARGYRVVRIPAADILKDATAVAAALVALVSPPPPPPAAVPLPVNGEDLSPKKNPPRLRGGGGASAPTEGGLLDSPTSQP